MECLACHAVNADRVRSCTVCSASLIPARTQWELDRAEVEIKKGRFELAALHLAKADGSLLQLPASDNYRQFLSARAFWLQGLIYYYHAQTDAAAAEMAQAADLLEGYTGGEGLRAQALINLGNINYYKGHMEVAASYYDQATEMAVLAGAHTAAARAMNNRANIHSAHGQSVDALNLYHAALHQAELSGDATALAGCYRLLSATYQQIGPYSQALEFVNKALSLRGQIDDQAVVCQIINQAASLYLTYGDLEQAEQYLREAYDQARREGNKLLQWEIVNNLIELSRQKGDTERWFNYASRTFNNPSTTLGKTSAALQLVRYYLSQSEAEQARIYVRWLKNNALAADRQLEDELMYNQAAALLHTAEESWGVADSFFQRAIEVAAEQDNPISEAEVCEEYAAMLRQQASSENSHTAASHAEATLRRAADLYRQLGIPSRLQAVEIALRQPQPESRSELAVDKLKQAQL